MLFFSIIKNSKILMVISFDFAEKNYFFHTIFRALFLSFINNSKTCIIFSSDKS